MRSRLRSILPVTAIVGVLLLVWPFVWAAHAALADNLVACYDFDTSPGLLEDAHSGNYDLTNNGSVSNTGTNAKIAEAASFGGSQSLTQANAAFDRGAGAFSFSTWYRPSSTGAHQVPISKGDGEWFLRFASDAASISFYATTGAGLAGLDQAYNFTSWSSGTWYHIVGTFDGGGDNLLRIYINGTQGAFDSSAFGSGIWNGGGDFRVGQLNGYPWDATGLVDTTAFWTRKLDSSEVTTLRNSGNGIACSAIIGGGGGGGGATPNIFRTLLGMG